MLSASRTSRKVTRRFYEVENGLNLERNRLLPLAQDKGIAIMVNRPFARARLFSAVQGQEVPAWAQELGMTSWAQVFLKFVVSHPAATVAIPATSKPHHMEDNMAGGQGELLTPTQRERVAGLIA